MQDKVVAIIPARYNSSRLQHKLLKKIKDTPIIILVYNNVRQTKEIDDVIIATDSKEIFDLCKEYNANVVMTSEHHPSGTSRIIEVAKNIECDIVINVQGDEPLIDSTILSRIIKSFEDKNIDIATLKKKIEPNSPLINDENAVKVVCDINDYAMYFSRATIPSKRSDNSMSVDYYKHIGVYAFRHNVLLNIEKLQDSEYEKIESLEQLKWLYNGLKIKVLETDSFIHGVDTESDLEIVENFLKNK